MKLIFLHADKHESLLQIGTMILTGTVKHFQSSQNSSLQCLYNISKKKLEMKLIFCIQINIKGSYKLISTLLGIKVPYKVILLLLLSMIKHSQSTQSNKIAIFLQFLKKEVRNGVHFLHADKHQNFRQVGIIVVMEVAR